WYLYLSVVCDPCPSSILVFSFFLDSCGALRYLLSFPTRRSSDLRMLPAARGPILGRCQRNASPRESHRHDAPILSTLMPNYSPGWTPEQDYRCIAQYRELLPMTPMPVITHRPDYARSTEPSAQTLHIRDS